MDEIFKALNDPARRRLLDSLRQEDGQSLTQLEEQLEMTRFGVMKHLKILEEANLVVSKKVGRFKYHYLNAQPLQEVLDRWIEPFLAKPLAQAMTALKSHLEEEEKMSDAKPDFIMQTFIKTTQDKLWAALTHADQIALYHFACSKAQDLPDGGHALIREDGSTMLTQRLVNADPKSRLEFTFEPTFMEEQYNSPSRIVFMIDVEGPVCKLTCEHYDLKPGQEGVREGWARHLASLKSWLETGEPIKLPA
jgi:DNA-binding transcriptional ArsR family regulator/uncharacterized protein YndB with AHSA1/START domain